MPRLTLGDVVEVVSRAGAPKANKVSEIKNRPPYSPVTDFYKALREGIVAVHERVEIKASSSRSSLGSATRKS